MARPALNRSTPAFASVTALFFAWGFICANNDPLVAAVRRIFDLSYTEALFTQIVFFAAFGILSLPAAALLGRVGAVRAMLIALAAMIGGCLIVQTTALVPCFPLLLAGLFVLASGIAILQVAANPLAASLGPPDRSHFRLALAQSFNSLGVVAGVQFGAALILGDPVFEGAEPLLSETARTTGLAAVQRAFLTIAALVLILMALLWVVRRPIEQASPRATGAANIGQAFRSRWALFGAVTIALYVGAEVAIGSTMIGFLADPRTLGLSMDRAGAWLATFYWGGALVGRFLGSWLLTRIAAPHLLRAAAVSAVLLCAAALLAPGPVAARCALAIGLCNAIMFPTIFSLTLERSTASAEATSGLLCVAISGGAIVPLLVGQVADRAGLGWIFVVPLAAYSVIAAFAALAMRRLPRAPRSRAARRTRA
ncbi:glucose/galactose MFS transporter [Sphingomonas sp. DG1-23]|uniref:glucose/galactose MFS transporter n=1 Tax=Sphingomonas sp. DG1-23 TaxID=3068316 RepID=UPI00273DA1CD|nr:glucose/galactose MFS transporter [Sphingomonas sp. DG1-23]MDP5279021.1 glucose/galactose MFS transporter [Sphingomonas sp. DG1-23]